MSAHVACMEAYASSYTLPKDYHPGEPDRAVLSTGCAPIAPLSTAKIYELGLRSNSSYWGLILMV